MRFDIDTYREIADALVRNKSRSLLTGFGIFWGLFMLLFLLGGGQGMKALLSETFEGFATNTTVTAAQHTSMPYKGFKEGRSWDLKLSDVERLKTFIPELDVVTPIVSSWGITCTYEDKKTQDFCSAKGVKADYSKVETPRLKYGRYINETDNTQHRKVCVIGKRIYKSLFPEGGDPCGTFIQVGSVYFQIVGVDFSNGNLSINGSSSQTALIPLTVAQTLYQRGDRVDLICMTGKGGTRMKTLEPAIRSVIARQHQFDPKDEPALMLLHTEQIFNIMDNLFKGVNFLIWLIGLGTLLAGAIGVSNIMMVTVKERTTEIGIRRAIGATQKQIYSQIIMESITLTVVAGCAGVVFSVLLLSGMEAITGKAVFQIGFWTAIITVALLAFLGVLAGLAPAYRAMSIRPVDAMRDE